MKPSIYIETTIIGHLTSRLSNDPIVAGQMLKTRQWWNESRDRFHLFSSDVVVQEASRGDAQAAAERLKILEGMALLPVPDTVKGLADLLLARSALPLKASVDAAHVAIAATNSIQYLLTWNCKHLANASLRERIRQVCQDQGYVPPIICTPFDLDEEPS